MEKFDLHDGSYYYSEYDFKEEDFVWMVTWYEDNGYDGSGEAVALGKDGLIYTKSLSHCSCYGAFDGGFGKGVSVEEYLRPKDNVLDASVKDEVDIKVRELLGVTA